MREPLLRLLLGLLLACTAVGVLGMSRLMPICDAPCCGEQAPEDACCGGQEPGPACADDGCGDCCVRKPVEPVHSTPVDPTHVERVAFPASAALPADLAASPPFVLRDRPAAPARDPTPPPLLTSLRTTVLRC